MKNMFMQLSCLLFLNDPVGLRDSFPQEQWHVAAWEAEVAGWVNPAPLGPTLAMHNTPPPPPLSLDLKCRDYWDPSALECGVQ